MAREKTLKSHHLFEGLLVPVDDRIDGAASFSYRTGSTKDTSPPPPEPDPQGEETAERASDPRERVRKEIETRSCIYLFSCAFTE